MGCTSPLDPCALLPQALLHPLHRLLQLRSQQLGLRWAKARNVSKDCVSREAGNWDYLEAP